MEVYLVNAQGTKNLPGRKSDVQECQWLMKLHTYGLLRNSFRPPEEIRGVRTMWRQRDRLVEEAGRTVQQMQKALTTMNVQLANVISDISGVSGMSDHTRHFEGRTRSQGIGQNAGQTNPSQRGRDCHAVWRDTGERTFCSN